MLDAKLPTTLLLACLATVGCNSVMQQPTNATRLLPARGLSDLQPADIAVAPVRNQTDSDDVPVELLRRETYEKLAQRLYSPLDLAFVDSHWVESAFSGEAPPDATLVMAITHWDASRLYSTGSVVGSAELRLFSGGSAAGDPLWGVAVTKRIELGDGTNRPPGPASEFLGRAVGRFVEEALYELPERDPLAAPR